jgi:hypothetical protein
MTLQQQTENDCIADVIHDLVHDHPEEVTPFVTELCHHLLEQFKILAQSDSSSEEVSHRGLAAAVRLSLVF